jgi:NADH-quinone oxidoreductase subunit G
MKSITTKSITVNGIRCYAEGEKTVLQVCRENGIDIPTLCNDERLAPDASCRLCLVEVEGRRNLMTSCSLSAEDGMVIETDSERVLNKMKN